MLNIKVNGTVRNVDASIDSPLLWVLRDHLGLTGTKFGCGSGLCGACTVHIDGKPVQSCMLKVSQVGNREIRTIESLATDGTFHAVQQAWLDNDVAQCGYCQSGQIMAAAALLQSEPSPNDEAINDAMMLHVCRCGSYQRIREAIKVAAANLAEDAS